MTMPPRRRVLFAVTGLLVAALALLIVGPRPAHAQGTRLATPNGGGLDVYRNTDYDLYRLMEDYSDHRDQMPMSSDPDWLHWWEVNRHRYVPAPLGGRVAGAGVGAAGVTESLDAFRAGLTDADENVRWASAIGLGRMRAAMEVPALVALTGDPALRPAAAACLALGLIGTPDAVAALVEPGESMADRPLVNAARLYALGLLDVEALGEQRWRDSIEAVRDALQTVRSDEERRAAVFAYRHLDPAGAAAVATRLLQAFDGFGVADEAVAALTADPDALWPVAAVLIRRRGRMGDLPIYARYLEVDAPVRGTLDLIPRGEAFGYVNAVRTRAVLAVNEHRDLLRTYAAVTRPREPGAEVVRALREDLAEAVTEEDYISYDGRHKFFRGLPLLTLGDIGEQRDTNLLVDAYRGELYPVEGVTVGPYLVESDRQRFTLFRRERGRTYAAIAMGLFLREYDGEADAFVAADPGRVHPSRTDGIVTRLLERVKSGEEDPAFRAAAAVSLGLAMQPGTTPRLQDALRGLEPSEHAVLGHGLLALAMLREVGLEEAHRDEHLRAREAFIVDQAEALLDAAARGEVFGDLVVSLRAVAQALTPLVNPRVDAVLERMLGLSPYLDEAVIAALADRGEQGLVPLYARRAAQPSNGQRAHDLWLLGSFFDPPRYGRLLRLVGDLNHTMPMIMPPAGYPADGAPGARPLGVVQVMAAPAYFELFRGGDPHRRFTYR